jgi:hypothetical protein
MRVETRARIENLAKSLKDLCQFRMGLSDDFSSCTLNEIQSVIIGNEHKFSRVEEVADLLMETALEWEKDND